MAKKKKETNDKLRKKAEKHISISLKVKQILKQKFPNTYVATYPARKNYQKFEKKSGKEFWSIILRSVSKSKVKNPDVIVTDEEKKVKYFIEVKWGAIKGYPDTDLNKITNKDINKLINASSFPGVCHVNGPAVKNHQRIRSKKFKKENKKIFKVDKDTEFLLISDFQSAKENIKNYKDILFRLKGLEKIMKLVDINNNVDNIPSLQEVIGF